MTAPPDAYWDDLGIAWCAARPGNETFMPRLRSRLRRQSFLITAGLAAGLPLCIAVFLLGVFTIWTGWTAAAWNFVTRGAALLAVSVILSIAALSLLSVRASHEARTLPEMLDLAVARGERAIMTIRLGYYACAVTVILGLAGTAIRTNLARPPALSPIVDLAVLAAFALGLFLYGRYANANLAKFRYLRHALAMDLK